MKKLKKKTALEIAIGLEKSVLKSTKIQVISKAIQVRKYMIDLMRIKKLAAIGAEQRENYDPRCLTASDDITVINQLDMDLVSLQMKVKTWI